MTIARAAILGGCFLFAVAACNAISGLSDLVVDADAVDAAPGGGRTDVAPGGDGGGGGIGDAGAGADGDVPVKPCGTGVCVPAGDGWSPVALPTSSPNCPGDYPNAIVGTQAPAASSKDCGCDCVPSGGNGCGLQLMVKNGGTCGNNAATITLNQSGCTALQAAIAGPLSLTNVVPPPTACAGTPAPKLSADGGAIRYCTGAPILDPTGCSADEICVAQVAGRGGQCVIHDGDVATCPSGMRSRYVIGSKPNDTRSCGSCSCKTTSCKGTRVSFYDTSACGGFADSLSTDGVCDDFLGGETVAGARVDSLDDGCQVSSPSKETGTFTFVDAQTICCQ